ncbi:Domain of uncharacterised function (DUF2825) [Arcanobacterium haemolyticum]|nr:Domain of uncharacterised function (DUF2825) [Arcanobacterium haemolyticum]
MLSLFPAHAGVFPATIASPIVLCALPRTRGGISGSPGKQGPTGPSSPHTRGYFQVRLYLGTPHALFPAHAGVFPIGTLATPVMVTLPRTRGGISTSRLRPPWIRTSSPHTRGYFLPFTQSLFTYALFPAHAGVFLDNPGKKDVSFALPRTRGGISPHRLCQAPRCSSSPHTRGYFHFAHVSDEMEPLFPAHAGVFPAVHVPHR